VGPVFCESLLEDSIAKKGGNSFVLTYISTKVAKNSCATSVVADRSARILTGLGVIERALVSGLICAALPLAGMVVHRSGPNLRSELCGSGCPTGFPDLDMFDRFAYAGRRLLTLPVVPEPSTGLLQYQQAGSDSAGFLQTSFLVAFAQIIRAILLARATATSILGLRPLSRSSHEPSLIDLRPSQFKRHGPNDQQASDITLPCFRYPSQALLASRRMLSRNQARPGGEVSPTPEC